MFSIPHLDQGIRFRQYPGRIREWATEDAAQFGVGAVESFRVVDVA